MCRHVMQRLRQVVGTGNDTVITYDDAANGNLALVEGLLCLGQCKAHILDVLILLFHVAKL